MPNPTTSSVAQAQAVLTYTTYLPLVINNSCTVPEPPSPFSLQIAALHQVAGSQIAALHQIEGASEETTLHPLTEAEWLAVYDAAYPTLMEALKESGADWARVRLSWNWIEPNAPQAGQPPEYLWGPYHDDKLRLVAETGVRMIATVADAPSWAAASPCAPIYPDRLDEFAQFLTDLVNHYKQPPYNIKHWELFNEPDGTWANLWAGGLGCWGNNAQQYAQMLAVAYPTIKAADPEATVLMGGVAHDWFTEYAGPFYRYFPDDVMALGGGNYIDGLSFHYFPDFSGEWDRWDPNSPDRRYGWLPAPTCGNLFDGQGTPYEAYGVDLIAKTTHFRNRMRTCFGVNKPVWVTELAEHGYANNPASLTQQARYVIQGHVRGLAAGIENITWYALTTPNDSYEQGLLFNDWTPKPAFYAYKTLTTELKGYKYARTLSVSNGEGYVFSTPCGQEKTVAWGSGSLALGGGRWRVVDRRGNISLISDGGPGDTDGAQNGTVKLQLSTDPLFISVQ
ncbi:MAG: cellulase family glycosylhydrolase [Chloroflexi bacterium]|nr:cellulase family glycosylhydrolase [Chloroflexota bacterium]